MMDKNVDSKPHKTPKTVGEANLTVNHRSETATYYKLKVRNSNLMGMFLLDMLQMYMVIT